MPNGEPVRDEGVGDRACRRLSDPHADARERQRQTRARQARHRGHRRPERQSEAHQPDAPTAIGQPPQRYPEERIEHPEGVTEQEADVRV